ncbi:MAG: metal-sulfur cluster assembly factor [Halobacteriota archaeon]
MSTPPDPHAQFEAASETEKAVWEAVWTVEDPELPVSIVDLGLVYDVTVEDETAEISMTLTYSGCPARELLVGDVETAVESVPSIRSVDVSLVYSPPWSTDHITGAGRDALTEYGLYVPDRSSAHATCDQSQ